MKRRFSQLLSVTLAFVVGFAVCWLVKDDMSNPHTNCVPRSEYQNMATQSNNNLNSFREALEREAKLQERLKSRNDK